MKKKYYIIIFIIIFLLICNCFKNVKLKNNINAKSICSESTIYKDNKNLIVRYCYDKNIEIVKSNNVINILAIKNVDKFYYFYSIEEDKTYFYIIYKGQVYTTNSENIFKNNYKVSKINGLNNIYDIEKLSVTNEKNVKEDGIYAIKNNGKLYFIKRI